MIGRLRRRAAATLGRRRFEREMADEMADHLAHRVEDLMRDGMPRARAERQARLDFGALEALKETCREARGLDLGDELMRNLRHAARIFARAPALTATVAITLGLGIGANVAVFSVVDAVLLRSLPYPQADRLAIVETRVGSGGEIEERLRSQDGRTWESLAAGTRLVDLAVFSDWPSGANVVAGGQALHLDQQRVGAGFFRVLGTTPLLGREFSPAEDVPGGPPVVVLGHALWQRLFAGDPGVLGRALQLRGEPYEIIGVMPAGFATSAAADLWTPLRPSTSGEGEGTNYTIIGRLRPAATWPAADAELAAIGTAPMAAFRVPAGKRAWLGIEPLQRGLNRDVRSRLLLSWLTVWLVLAVGCINVAGLLLAHAARRSREIATRMALGCGRGAIVRQLLTESLALSSLGGTLGLAIGVFGARLLRDQAAGPLGIWQPVGLDGRVLAVALGLAVLTVLLSGLYPALKASRLDLRTAQGDGDTKVAGGRTPWPRRLLVIAQLAVVVALLVAAGLVVRTLVYLQGLEPGFDPGGAVAATVSLEDARYQTAERASRLLESVAERLRREPDIAAAAAGLSLPYERPLNMGFTFAGDSEPKITNLSYVTAGYFETLGIRLAQGRLLGAGDRGDTPPAAVVNQAFVDTYLEGKQPLGVRIATGGTEREIVGVVADTQQQPGWGDAEPIGRRAAVFVPVSQTSAEFLRLVHSWFQPSWVVRPAVAGIDLAGRLRDAVAAVDPQLPLAGVRSLYAVRNEVLSRERFQAALLAAAAAVALILAAVGLGGLIATSVAERRRELGIRMALGATRPQTIRAAALPGLVMAAAGLALGLVLALGVVRGLRAFVYGVGVFDPATYAVVAAVLLAVATLASLLPALRLLRLDPATTLRAE